MSNITNRTAEQSYFICSRDTNNKINRIAFPSNVQIGLKNNPSELNLFGRLSLSNADYVVYDEMSSTLWANNNDVIINVITTYTPDNKYVTVILPSSPRDGELHFIKDLSGTAGTIPIKIFSEDQALIDNSTEVTLDQNYASLAIYWKGNAWTVLVAGAAAVATAISSSIIVTAPIDANYLTLTSNPALTSSRAVVDGDGISFVDSGPLGNLTINLDLISGDGIQLVTESNGQVRIINTGNPDRSADTYAPYILLNTTSSLPNGRILYASASNSGILMTDAGPNNSLTIRINNAVVATISGSTFTGPVIASSSSGFTGSLTRLIGGQTYLAAGPGLLIQTSSIGQVILTNTYSASLGGGGSWIDNGNVLSTTSSISIAGAPENYADPVSKGLDVFFYVSGTVGRSTGSFPSAARVALFGGDIKTSGSLYFGAGTKIVKNVNELVLYDDKNSTGISLTQIANTVNNAGADVSSSYLVVAVTGALPNERALTAGENVWFKDSGAGSTFTINAPCADKNASYIVLSSTASMPNERVLTAGSRIQLSDAGPGNSLTISVVSGSDVFVDVGGALSTTSSIAFSNGTENINNAALKGLDVYFYVSGTIARATGSSPSATRTALFGGDVKLSGSLIFDGKTKINSNDISFLDSSTKITRINNDLVLYDYNNPTGWTLSQLAMSGSTTSSGSTSGGITPIYSMPILSAVASSNTSNASSKQTLGSIYYNPFIVNNFSGSKTIYFRTLLSKLSTETNLSGAVDLYDVNGIVRYPPGIITGSTISSSIANPTLLTADLTSILSAVTGSGIIEARMWRTISGTLASSVICYSSKLDVEYT